MHVFVIVIKYLAILNMSINSFCLTTTMFSNSSRKVKVLSRTTPSTSVSTLNQRTTILDVGTVHLAMCEAENSLYYACHTTTVIGHI